MDVIERLTKQGKDLGYEGETLQTFVKEQQIELRDERKAMREAERERREAERESREAENAKREAEAKLERERREADAKLEREKLELMERIEAQKREIEKESREAAREAREAETAKHEAEAKIDHDKREAEELFKREELETMERIEREKHDIEREKIEAAERQRKEEREAAERHDQLLCDMEKAKLALEQDKINSQQFQQQRDHEFKCQLQDRQHEGELERLEAQKALTQPRETIKAKAPKIPAFNEGKDEMDSYLLRFERYATAQKWEPDTWATGLSALLQGKALDVYALMPKEDALNYDKLKAALLKRYELTEEGFKRKYKKRRPENGETFQQFTTRMKSYFTRWIDMASIEKSYEGLQDLILREQLTFICNRDLELFLCEREPKSLEQASKLADQYKEARYVDIVSLTYKNNERSRSRSNSESRSRSRSPTSRGPNQGNQGYPRPRVRCYNCGGPHVRRFCPQLKQGIMKAGAVDYRRSRSPTRKVTFQTQEPEVPKEETAKDGNQNTEPKVCGACLILTDAVNYSQATTNEREMVKTSVGSPIKVSSVSSLSEMSTVQGFVGEKPVEVLRDTGCSGVIVSKDLVPESAYTGRSQTMVMVDYSSRVVPEVKVSIDTPYYKGEVLALCVEKPLVGLIIGNIPGARERNNPDINWVPALAVQTRAQAKREGVTSKLKTPSIIDRTITPAQVSKAQKDDLSLTTTRSRCEANETIGKATFLKKNDLLYRKFSSPNVENGRTFTQLIVPQQYRTLVMKLAHESVMAGHLAIKRTMQKVLSEFYWPGINSDIKRFCQSCDICQRTIPKGKIVKAPLGKMPRIDVPFRRVATDLIGPLKPVTYNKNRYILTLVDYATRYPEAVPLASIDTETVAEALVSIFSRVGIPHEVLTDMGTQYTSAVMKEVSRLLSFKQLVTTPYHPICNGLVERFNQTIKKMLMRMCAERPKDWDKYIDPLLFAYREAPQESLGFSPFELLYGWPVRGPMQILKQLWSKEIEDPEVRSTYQYVIELRDRLESTLEIAQDNLSKMSRKYKRHYDQKAGKRQLKVGDKALVLLPTDKNKLLMGWKGPYEVVEKLSPLDYRIRISGKEKSFHINMLKQYVEREDDQEMQSNDESQVCAVSLVDLTAEEMEDECSDGLIETPSVCKSGEGTQVNINPALSQEEQHQVRSLVQEFSGTFSEKPGRTTLMEHDIKLTTDTPLRVKQYPLPYSMMQAVNDEVRSMIELGVIERSESPYCSPVIIVKKKDNTNRFCIDFRVLNKITVFDAEPMPSCWLQVYK